MANANTIESYHRPWTTVPARTTRALTTSGELDYDTDDPNELESGHIQHDELQHNECELCLLVMSTVSQAGTIMA